jgi:hypothetical protein
MCNGAAADTHLACLQHPEGMVMMHIPLNVSANRAVAIVSLTGMLVATTAARGDDWATAQTAPRGSIVQLLRQSGLNDLAACRTAAARHCDSSGGMTANSLLQCGATLAAVSDQIGNQCRRVLRRYGQLH